MQHAAEALIRQGRPIVSQAGRCVSALVFNMYHGGAGRLLIEHRHGSQPRRVIPSHGHMAHSAITRDPVPKDYGT